LIAQALACPIAHLAGQAVADAAASPRLTPARARSAGNRVLSGLINESERVARNGGRPRSKPKSYFERHRLKAVFEIGKRAMPSQPGQ
jgi:hypothetical protein